MSLGHLISGFSTPIFSRVFATATPVASVMSGSLEWSTFGVNMIDSHTHPNGDSQAFPDLPLAAVCFSEITTLPFSAPLADRNLASVLVEFTSL